MKAQMEEVTVVLVTPLWETQPWFPMLTSMLVAYQYTSSKYSRSDHSVPQLRLSSLGNPPTASHMECLRQRLRTAEIPNNAIDLIMSSWRGKTKQIPTITLPRGSGKHGASREVYRCLFSRCFLYPSFLC